MLAAITNTDLCFGKMSRAYVSLFCSVLLSFINMYVVKKNCSQEFYLYTGSTASFYLCLFMLFPSEKYSFNKRGDCLNCHISSSVSSRRERVVLAQCHLFKKRTKYKLKILYEVIQTFKEKSIYLALARGIHHFIILHIMSSFPVTSHNDQLAH